MVDITNTNFGQTLKETNSAVLTNIDKCIEIRYMKEKKKSFTYVAGLENFIEKEKDIEKFTSMLQKKLACGQKQKVENGKTSYGFNGDHIKNLKKIIMTELKVPEDKIKG